MVAILAGGAVLRVVTYFDLAAADPGFFQPSLDSRVFLDWAREIASGKLLGDRPFFLNPLYPYFLSPFLAVSPESPLLLIRLVQGAMGLASVALVAGAARRLLGPQVALGAAAFAASYPLLLFYEQMVMIVTLAVFLNALTLYLLARLAESGRLRTAAFAGLPLGLAILARPNVGLFALLLPLWLLGIAPAGRRIRFAATRTAALAAVSVLVVLPVTIHNAVVGHDFVPVTSSMGINLWQCNNPQAWKTGRMGSDEIRFNPRFVETDAIRIAEEEEGRELASSEVSAYWQHRALRTMRENPGKAAGFLARKAVYFLGNREAPSSLHYEMQRSETTFLALNPLGFWLMGPLGLAGAVLVLLRRRRGLPFALLFVVYWVGLVIFYPLGHYRAPVLPAVFPLAALALGALIAPIRARRWRALALPATIVVLSALLANGTTVAAAFGVPKLGGYPAETVTWWYNQGVTRMQRDELDEAVGAFERAREADATSWLPDMGLAEVARLRGDLDKEAHHLDRAIRLKADNSIALCYMGRNLFRRGRREQGLNLAASAVRMDPRDPNLRRILAALLMDAGRPDDALRNLEEEERLGYATPDNLARQVWCLRRLGNVDEGFRRVERGLRRFPDFPPLYLEQAYLLIAAGADPARIRAAVRAARASGARLPPDLARFAD